MEKEGRKGHINRVKERKQTETNEATVMGFEVVATEGEDESKDLIPVLGVWCNKYILYLLVTLPDGLEIACHYKVQTSCPAGRYHVKTCRDLLCLILRRRAANLRLSRDLVSVQVATTCVRFKLSVKSNGTSFAVSIFWQI